MNTQIYRRINSGFTLIELLIVMAILGVLAVVVLVAINPAQQLARTRDAGRFSGVTQIGRATQAFSTVRAGTYPSNAAWHTELVAAGELSNVPATIPNTLTPPACGTNVQQNWCYAASAATGGVNAIVFSKLEANSNISLCAAGQTAFAVYDSVSGRGGIVCTAGADPGFNPAGQPFVN
jgi:prepilin-type N-terminal cleavage/methylation domain-containing protein